MKYSVLLFCFFAWNCSDEITPVFPEPDMSINDKSDVGTTQSDVSVSTDAPVIPVVEKTLPDEFGFEGVAYIGHLESSVLQWIRTDGSPRMGGELDLGEAIIELAIDRKNHILAAALPAVAEVKLFRIDTPKNDTTPIESPKLLATLSFDSPVLGIKFDPFNQRLYAVKTLPVPADGSPQTQSELYIYNTENPQAPTQIGDPTKIPASISWDIDPVRRVLFLFDGINDLLRGYDLANDSITPLPGAPIDFGVWYPETNQTSFKVRNLKVDPWSNRIFGARSQGAFSELITIQYDGVIPNSAQNFSDISSMDKLQKKDDGFDASVDLDNRPFILDAANPIVDRINGMVWLVTASWDGSKASYGTMSLRDDTLALDKNCEDSSKGLMCWYRSYFNGQEQTKFHYTDGAACADGTHKVFVGTSYDTEDNTQPGNVHLFKYTSSGEMTRVELEKSVVKAYPVAAICH